MKNKKTLALALALVLTLLTACGMTTDGSDAVPPVASGSGAMTPGSSMGDTTGLVPTQRLGLGVVASTERSLAATAEAAGNVAYDATVCAVILDANDNIVSVRFDGLDNDIGFDATGAFTGDVNAPTMTQRGGGTTIGDGLPWHEQTNALENWMMGKPYSEAMGMKLNEMNVPDIDELRSNVTMDVSPHMEALERAIADAKRAA